MSLYDDVYGLSYKNAENKINILNAEIKNIIGQGFSSKEELVEWANDHLLNKLVYMNMTHKFFCVSHKGELLTQKDFEDYYKTILFTQERVGNRFVTEVWSPSGFEYYDKAYIAAEQSDGIHKPLYYRDYTVPSG